MVELAANLNRGRTRTRRELTHTVEELEANQTEEKLAANLHRTAGTGSELKSGGASWKRTEQSMNREQTCTDQEKLTN